MSTVNDTSVLERLDQELTSSSRYYMFISIVAAWAWAIYLTYYNSRVLGLIITAVINKFLKYGHIKLGSFSFSVLSGKVMFRDVHLITDDYSVRVEYGFLIFRWWRPYVYKELAEDLSHQETRMTLFIDGFEFHVYNRTAVYSRLEKLFGLRGEDESEEVSPNPDVSKKAKSIQEIHWRDLVPVTKIDISSFPFIPQMQCRDLTCLIQTGVKEQRLKSNVKQVRKTLNQEVEASRLVSDVRVINPQHPRQVVGLPPQGPLPGPASISSGSSNRACPIWLHLFGIAFKIIRPHKPLHHDKGRIIFGNYLMPHSMLLKFERADMVYTTKPASTVFDLFMHVVKCAMENVQLMLVPSPKYNGPVQDEPPRYMGDGFVILMSNDVDIYFYMDEPGIVQHELEQIQMADGEVLVKRTYPCVGVEVKCNKNTNFNYGPWVDRQREHIWKFFYPADYQPLIPTREAEPGEKRQYRTMEFKMTINANSTIDILFTKNAITQAIHIDAGKGSYIEVTIPWITEESGYTTKVKGQLMLVDATTSMSYRSLLECETLEFDVTAYYPKIWNAAQDWRCDFTACKASTYLIFDLKHFFADLVNDWSSKATPDLYSFVPYTWTISLLIKQFEVLTLANENNWVDTSSQHLENAHVAFCGEMFELCATFPFTDFLPQTVPISLVIKGENVICSLYLPENNTIRHSVIAISQNVKVVNQNGNNCDPPFRDYDKLWRKKTLKSDGWVDCWTSPYVFLTVLYTYYPMPILNTQEDNLLHPSSTSTSISMGDYPPHSPSSSHYHDQPSCSTAYWDSSNGNANGKLGAGDNHSRFDPGVMEPDLIQVELEVAPSVLVLYGSLLRNLIHLKENYLGEYQKATDFVSNPRKMKDTEASYVHIDNPQKDDSFDARLYRPFAVTVSVTLHDLHAHLAKNCTSDGLPCPSVHIERLCFEMDKSFRETKLQVLLSPCVLLAKDSLSRSADQGHLKEGHLALSGVQVRGHAMFSLEGLPLDSETLEYGWLIEATIGELTGKLTTPQLKNIVEFLQTFILMVENAENKLQTSVPFKTCQHMKSQDQCPESKVLPFLCPNSEEIKYEMIRLSVDFVSIFVVESGSALNLQIHPVKVAHCNLHGHNTRAGITGLIDRVEVKQYVSCVWACPSTDNWLEAGGISLGPVMLEAAMALPHPHLYQNQDKFLRYHDAKTKRLWFLWPESEMSHPPHPSVIGKCGCLGGCAFFGKNKNGLTFFKPKRSRGESGGHGAVPHVTKDGGDPGFGQSLLHSGKLVFETSHLSSKISPTKTAAGGSGSGTAGAANGFAFTRGYMSELTSPEGANDKELFGDDTTAISPTDDLRPGSSTSDTVTLISGDKLKDIRRYSKESVLFKHSPLPASSSPKDVLRSSSKKGRKIRGPQNLTRDRSKSHKKSSNSVHSESLVQTDSVDRPSKSRNPSDPLAEKVYSRTSLNSEHYFTANESDSEDDTKSTQAWSYPGTPSPISVFDDDDPAISTIKKMPAGRKQSKRSSSFKSIDKKQPTATGTSSNSTGPSIKSSVDLSDSSTMSFQSAPTDRDSDLSETDTDDEINNTAVGEDMLDMVNLHSHMNQAITESPLLLSCYSQHLSHYCCQDWSSSAPQSAIYSSRTQGLNSVLSEYSLSSAGHSVYSAGTTWTPQFVKIKEGFSVSVMKPRPNVKLSPSNLASDLFNVKATLDREHKQQKETMNGDESARDNISKTTAVVQLSGSLDVLVTPLFLESLQRCVEAVIPTLSKIHPSALIDGLHYQCLDRLKQQNKLKKGKGQDPEGNKEDASLDNLENLKEVIPVKKTSLQALFTLPKINICVLQASIVEEVIAFSNLGSVSDLTAASLLAVCIDGIKCQLLSNKHACKVAIENKKEVLTRKTSSTPSSSAKAGGPSGKGKGEVNPLEPDLEKPQEVTREENVGTLQISHIHIQLRRLLKFSNFSEHVLLTAIPEHSSRVLFTLEQDITSPLNTLPTHPGPQGSSTTNEGTAAAHLAGSTQHQPSPRRKLMRTLSRDKDSDFMRSPDTTSHSHTLSHSTHAGIGFIMCECGLEDVSVTAVRRLGYQETSEAQMEEKLSSLEQTVNELQEKARLKFEDEEEGGKKDAEGKSGRDKTGEGLNDKNNKEEESVASSSEGPIPLSSPSCRMTSASMDSSSPWDSDKSNISSDDTLYESQSPLPEPLEGDASNGRLELKTIWFNFASPPPISIHKKMDFTRLDWNLLSTATPAIDAWLNPSDRLMNSVRRLIKAYSKRLCSVMACMMIEGLESSSIHLAYKSKFSRLTPLSKTLQEDPSNQLLTVLRKYIQKHGTDSLERAVSAETVPQLITVQKGILALMRQWKNVLYMPNLSQINFKTRRSIRPYNVSFALPNGDGLDQQTDDNEDLMMDHCDVVDERIALLQAEGGSVPSVASKRHSVSTQGKTDAMDYVSADSHLSAARPRKLSSMLKHKKASGISDSALDRSTSNLAPPPVSLGLNRIDSNASFTSLNDSISSNEQLAAPTPPATPLRTVGPKQSILKNRLDKRFRQNEDLYQWMAKQQEDFPGQMDDDDSRYIRQSQTDQHTGMFGSTWSQDDSRTDLNEGDFTMATSIMQLADAQILFKPVLQSLGLHVESVRPSAMMKKFGGHLLLQGHFNTFKILIAESEASLTSHHHHMASVSKGKGHGKRTFIKRHLESAAFQCESFEVNVSLKDVIKFSDGGRGSHKFPFAMHKLEAKPSTLQINLMVNCHAVRQNVDMALLRLAHQVLTMVGNVKETRVELKQNRLEHQQGLSSTSWVQTHRKQESKDSTSSADTQHSDMSHTEHIFGSFRDILRMEKDKDTPQKQSKNEGIGSSPRIPTTPAVSAMRQDLKWTPTPSPRLKHIPGDGKLKFSHTPTSPAGPSTATTTLSALGKKLVTDDTEMTHVKGRGGPAGIVETPKGEAKARPQELPFNQLKKPTHLRFAQDSKGEQQKESISDSSGAIMTPPQSFNLSDSVVLDLADTSSPALNEKTIIDEIEENTPQCWRHLYQLLELYATMPEPKTVARRQAVNKLPVIEEEEGGDQDSTKLKRDSRVSDYGIKLHTLIQNSKSSVLHGLRRESTAGPHSHMDASNMYASASVKAAGTPVSEKHSPGESKVDLKAKEEEALGNDSSLARQSFIRTRFKQSIYVGESIPIIVFGICKVEKVIVNAELSGLKLEAHITKVHATGTYKKKVKGFVHRVSSDSSFTAHVGHSMINLREGEPPDWQTVVTINISKSQALLSSAARRGKDHNSLLTSVGLIEIDIPQHPIVLHDMMARSTKRITATLQELRWPMQSTSRVHFAPEANLNQSSVPSSSGGSVPQQPTTYESTSSHPATKPPTHTESKSLLRHIHFKSVLQGITIGASILPSLKAHYKTGAITFTGVVGKKVYFTVMLPKHLLSFKSRVTAAAAFAETPIPSAASIELPPIQVRADYRVQKQHQQDSSSSSLGGEGVPEIELTEGLELLEGNYLYAVGEVGMLEHSLTTDLLNHLIFVQKVFMKEINEIVQKVSGSGTGVNENTNVIDFDPSPRNSLLYSVSIRFKGIQVTATTPTSNAVRFETGAITLDLSNRYHLPMKEKMAKDDASQEMSPSNQKMFIQAVVDLNLALGQLITNPVFEEAEPEFHTMAFFKTTIKIRNALQHEMIPNLSQDQEALLISLMRPIILAQPLAFDKAVLVWLNYKNAYEYWTEQRMALNKEVLRATRQVIDKLPTIAPTTTNPSISTLFLQLTVDDMGICVPLLSNTFQVIPAPGIQSPRVTEAEQGAALVLTVESTQISACSSGSLVSKGKFKGFCVRFADDFGSSWDDWKPWPTDYGVVMNQCKVPSGTYEVCSRTINKQDSSGNAKWILNVQWDMKGIDVHMDTDIGKSFTLLGSTLTMLAGQSDDSYIGINQQTRFSDDELDDDDKEDDEVTSPSSPDTQTNSREELPIKRRTSLASDILPEEIFADDFDPKERARKIEQEMNEQAKVVQELKECGAMEATIETERKKLEDLQALLFRDFRRDFLEMLKRKGDRASIIKEKLGLSARPSTGHYRSKSTGGQKYLRAPLGKHYSIDAGSPTRRQSEHLTRPTRVSFSGAQLNTYTPPHSPNIDPFEESGSEREDDDIIFGRKRSRSLEVITSSGSDSQAEVMDPLTTPQLRRPHKVRNSAEDTSGASPKDVSSKLSEQSIDFELDVKVFIDRGNCVLYPKEAKEEEARKNAKQEKRGSGGDTSPPSKRKLKKETSLGSGLGGQSRKISGQPDTSIFFIPSVDVKVHYNSRTENLNDVSTTDESFFMASSSSSGLMTESTPRPYTNTTNTNPHPFVPEITVTYPTTIKEETTLTNSPRDSMLESDSINLKKGGQLKRANLYAWFSLKALPEEMIISPPVLDFLEQALEPLPMTSGGGTTSSILRRDMVDTFVNNMDMDASQGSLGQQSMAFFPVDVVVHIKVDPSFIRFNCHPVSRVECLLQMPSLDLFFSTKKTDINESMLAETSFLPKSCQSTPARTRHPSSGTSTTNNDSTTYTPSSANTPFNNYNTPTNSNSTPTANSSTSTSFYPGSSSGGLSVTGCMSDFSLYIFHPYGTGVQRRLATHGDQTGYRSPGLGSISENATHSLLDMGRRDSLSLNVEYIRVNISRTRKLERSSELGDSPSKTDQQTRSNAVRFSAICDIGTASFKYDMRRLTEILSLPKAWYRRTLARRLFLGDENVHLNPGEEPESPTSSSTSASAHQGATSGPPSQNSMSHPSLNLLGLPSPLKKHHRRGSSGDKIRVQLSPEFKSEIATRRALRQPDQVSRDQSTRKKSRTLSSPDMQRHHRPSVSSVGTASLLSTSWETLVLFAVNLSQLNLEVNMANVMGNTEWCTKGVKSQGRLSINSSGHKNLNIEAGFDKSTFESKGGIVGGNIGVESLKGHFTVSEDPGLGQDPDHQAGLSTSLVETKLDYMGSSIIMTRLSHLSLLLKDEWHVDSNTQKDAPLATNRSAFLFVNGKLSWSHFHLMISRSTTPDLIKIISKLDEFFSQQVMSGRRAFQHSAPPYAAASHHPRKISESAVMNELRHHRHWQGALQHLLGCHFSMLPSVLPKDGMVLGGTMTLQGQGLMLASFHGINFRARSWALFNIKDLYIYFATEAQRIPEGGSQTGTHIVQDLQFVVGRQGADHPMGVSSSSMSDAGVLNNMATICKISRTQHMPSNFTSIDEWFTYALTSSVTDHDVVNNFSHRTRDPDGEATRKYSKAKGTAYHSHDTEVIFSFPSMYMDLKTSHLQGDEPPQPDEERPVVECSFVAEFYDHIYVAMDAEVILFLHDLVASYIKEKDKGLGSKSSSASAKAKEEKATLSDPTSALKHDYRAFECKTWQLEPTLRLIHWASTRIDPVGADYVLQKLGFSKARVTIPKWVQRGFMDPLDKVLSMLVDKLIITLRDQQGSTEEGESSSLTTTTTGANAAAVGGAVSVDLDASIGPVGSDTGLDRVDRY